jgi:hypothetical protein
MKQLLKENIVLVAGICLPLLLAAIFWGAKQASIAGIAPPQSEVVFIINNDENPENPWDVEVRDDTVHVLYAGTDGKRAWRQPELFVFNPVENVSRRVEIPRLAKEQFDKKQDIVPEALANKKVSTEDASPEGYVFIRNDGGYNRGLITEVFSGQRDRSQFILQKGNYRMQVPQSGYNAKFIGWITP